MSARGADLCGLPFSKLNSALVQICAIQVSHGGRMNAADRGTAMPHLQCRIYVNTDVQTPFLNLEVAQAGRVGSDLRLRSAACATDREVDN